IGCKPPLMLSILWYSVCNFSGAAAAWPLAARAQQPAVPVVGLLSSASPGPYQPFLSAYHTGLKESGYVEGHNVAMECEPRVGGHSCNGGMIPRFHRAVCD